MADQEFGAKFSIDITDLKTGLTQANRLIRESESQFREAAAKMEDWGSSADGLEARMNSLNHQVDIQKQKVKALIDHKNDLIETMQREGKTQEEIDQAIDKVNKAIERESKQLDRLQRAADKSERELEDFRNASKDAGESADDAADDVKDLDEAFQMLDNAGKIAVAAVTAVAAAAAAAVGKFLSLAESTREYREDMGKLATAFEAAGVSTEIATDTYKEFYSVLGEEDRSVEAVNHLAKFVETEQDFAKWTEIATGVWGTFGDSLPIEGLTEAA